MKNTPLSIALLFASSALSTTALADEQPKQPQAVSSAELADHLASPNATQKKSSFSAKEFADTGRQNPAPIEAGPFYIYPTLGLSFGHDDNITRAASNEIRSSAVMIAPSIVADLVNNGDRYVLGYNGRFTRYFGQSANNTDSHELQFQAQNAYSARLSTLLFANVLQAEDQVGATDSASKSPDRYRQYSLRGMMGYGAPDATGRLEGEITYVNKGYLNNRASTALLDQETLALAGRFFYRVAPRTRALLEARYQDINYDREGNRQNSQEYRAYTGVTWDADAYFTSSAKVGMMSKKYDDARRGSYDDFSYEALVRFMPRTYSSIDFTAVRTIAESTGVGNYLLDDMFSVAWNHAWSNFTSTRTTLSYVASDYVGATRNDDTFNAAFNIDYKLTRWLKTGIELRYENRNSNINSSDYTRGIYMVNLSGSL
ncbi:outer membrane beta-barrel protein [Chitinibacter sp. GC72]|uniref:outer membrane beta-barrel protein n=1 Tax=Chitinibacter sp. GC72 TaxID=1526917 RepID=UPI0012FC6B2C|nr:outer membrane beta-barrel protein [Chitinibacter sp. GC72]